MTSLLNSCVFLLVCLPGVVKAGWSRQTSGVGVTLRDMYFTDIQNGYCVGDSGVILHTSNGGASWERQTSGTSERLSAVCFPDLTDGWAAGGETQEVLLKTTNGGVTWAAVSTGIGLPLGGVTFTDHRNGWVSGAVQDVSYEFYALKTTDGGANWSRSRVDWSVEGGLTRIFAKDSNHVWVGGGDILFTPPLGTLYHSFYGASWRVDIGWFSRYYPGAQPCLFGIHFPVDTLWGWTCGTAFDPTTGQPLEDKIIHTPDGVTWYSYYTEILNAKGLYDVHFTDLLNGWVVGGSGTILRTTNGGLAWASESSGVTADLYGLHFSDGSNGWACGGAGTILKYTGGVGVEEENPNANVKLQIAKFKITPNPFVSFAKVPGHERETFSLYDISGRLLGVNRGDRIGEGLAPGVYFVVPKDRNTKPIRVVKVR